MNIRQSNNYANYMKSLGWIVERIGDTNVFIKKILVFSVIKIQRPNKLDFEKLKTLQKKYRAIHTNIEPSGSGWHLIPTKTIIIDLENLNIPKDTRYEIRKAEKSGVFIGCHPALQGDTLQRFVSGWHRNARDRGFWVPISKEIKNLALAFGGDAILFMADGAGALVVINQNTAHYMYAFSTPAGRKISAPYLVMWEIIKFCQNKKLKFLDLEGIYDERYPSENKSWQGFTKFKLGWGGKVIEY